MGVANPNFMRDKRVLEIKPKNDFYVMPTFNANNLRMNTKKFKNDFDNDTLTIYSGGGYVAKSKLASSYGRRRIATAGSKRPTHYSKVAKHPRRFNEQLDTASQKSVNRRRALSRGTAQRGTVLQTPNHRNEPAPNLPDEDFKKHLKDQILTKIDKMTEEEIDKVSKQLDEISKAEGEYKHHDEFGRDESQEIDQEQNDYVADLPNPANYQDNKSITELSEYGSRTRDVRSRSSKRSSKSYISKLRLELESERAQRQKLESEIEELKKLSTEIGSKLGIHG